MISDVLLASAVPVDPRFPMPTMHLLARAVIRDEGHVLVVQADGREHTFLPGGHLEAVEGMRTFLRRELSDELDAKVTVGRYLGAVEYAWRRQGERQYELNHFFSVSGPSLAVDAPPSPGEDFLTFAWVPVEQLDAVALEPTPLRRLLADDTVDETWWESTLDPATRP